MGGSTEWEDQLRNQKNIVSTDERNPFHDWNHVYMRYCSGDTWVGTNTEESGPGRFGLWFSGHYQVEAALTYVRDTWGIGSEEGGQFMLAGGSAANSVGWRTSRDDSAGICSSAFENASVLALAAGTTPTSHPFGR